MKLTLSVACFFLLAASALAQIQVELKLPRLQYIAHEPVVAKLSVTNLAGRDVDLRDADGRTWFGFEITGSAGQPIAPLAANKSETALSIPAGKTVTQKINLTPLYSVNEFGTYRVRAHVYFTDLGKFFYSQTKVFQVTDARPIWQKTVGTPEGTSGAGDTRTYSLLSNRFPDHTALYVRVEDKSSGIVYATYSLGRVIAFDEPQAEIDNTNHLHILHCAAPRSWAYSHVGLNGELLARSAFMESKTRPRLRHASDGTVLVMGGTVEAPVAQSTRSAVPKLSTRPPNMPKNE
ncbi:MAG: hypothetical protein QOI22_846 [Verrucomicrobiota bacterium]|jgi:hypothetical protein